MKSKSVRSDTEVVVAIPRGRALSTALGALDIPWQDAFKQMPITVEVWAMPKLAKEWLVTCAYPQAEGGITGWGLTVGGQGELAAVIVGPKTRWTWNQTPILDGKWHHLAMAFDGTEFQLYVDGQCSHQEITPTGAPQFENGPGLHVGAQLSVVCESLIEEVRISSGIRKITTTNDRFRADEQTLGLWRFDDVDEKGCVRDASGHGAPGTIRIFPRESLDDVERRDYHAGPVPLDLPAQKVELTAGTVDHAARPAVISLDGLWNLAEEGDEQSRLNKEWMDVNPAEVPGSIHAALEKAGKIPDPKFARNDALAREKSFKTWWMSKTFPRLAGSGHRLIFDGVAIHCTVWLNGVKLGEHEGMFGGPEFDVSHLLRDQNRLIVRIGPAPTGPPEFAPTHNTGWRKTVVFNNVYGWHYSDIPALGIWRSVRVEAKPVVRILNPFVVTHDAEAGEISIRVDLEGPATSWRGRLLGTIAPENFSGSPQHFAIDVSATAQQHSLHLRMRVPDARAWWPNGLGEPNLYRLTLSLKSESGKDHDSCSTTFGLRTLAMAPFPGGPRQCFYNWAFIINGRPTFLKGTGWCTMDSSMDFRRERYERFLKLAQQQNCQMVRGWGSGMPETDDFYDLCDRLGITVLQEWPTAWNSHQNQPYDVLEETVKLNMLRLRNHPSLLMWGGGNESNNPSGEAINMMGRNAIELDGTRPFHRGEPWGGSDHNYACWWGDVHLDHNLKMTSRFFGEFGIASMPVMESVQRYLPENEKNLWPPADDSVFAHHTPVFNTMKDMQKLRQYAGYFTAGDSMERFIMGSQLAQAVAVRHTLERARTRWPECAGVLMYKLNDNYPAASWATADWYGAVKISHWFVQDAFSPLHACVLFDSVKNQAKVLSLPVFLLDDPDALRDARWIVKVRAYDGGLRCIKAEEFAGSGAINHVRQMGEFKLNEQQTDTVPLFLVAEIYLDDQLTGRTFYFVNYEAKKNSLFELPRITLAMKINSTSREVILTNTGPVAAVGATVTRPEFQDTFSADDNCVWLDAGESKTIRVSETNGLRATAWNLETSK